MYCDTVTPVFHVLLYTITLQSYNSSLLSTCITFQLVTPLHFRHDTEHVLPKKRNEGKFIQIYNTALVTPINNH